MNLESLLSPVNGASISPSEFSTERASPQSFSANWGYVKAGLLAVKKNSPTVTWIPEQVRRQVERGFVDNACEFFFCVEGNQLQGFYIMLPQLDPWLSINMVWLCWIAYSSSQGMLDRLVPIAKQQARERGYAAIDFVTAMPRLARHMEKHGFHTTQIISRMVVD